MSGVEGMSDGTDKNSGGHGDREHSAPDEAALSERLGNLDQRLSRLRGPGRSETDRSGDGSGDGAARASAMARGFRLSSELIAGVAVGALIGWGVDRLLSTSPWGLIVFFLLGFAAGVINVMRSAGVIPEQKDR